MKWNKLIPVFLAFAVMFSNSAYYSFPASGTTSDRVTALGIWCGELHVYTDWRGVKPILYVWKGEGKQNPKHVSVYYNDEYVPNADNGIRVDSPQVDTNDGWVGYYISKRWVFQHPNWNDDWRWEFRACIP